MVQYRQKAGNQVFLYRSAIQFCATSFFAGTPSTRKTDTELRSKCTLGKFSSLISTADFTLVKIIFAQLSLQDFYKKII